MRRTGGSHPASRRRRSGQTVTEYLMIVGLLTAMIIALNKIFIPTIAWVVVQLVRQVVIYISSV